MKSFQFQPIGFFYNSSENPNEAPRQPNPELKETSGVIELSKGFHFDEALRDLNGFSQIWILFHFHKNDHWNPLVLPPRGSEIKRGVFATRSPYRPNPIGMSILDLISIDGLTIRTGPSDLLNRTPILDIKPYIPFVDSQPNAKIGWLQESADEKFSIVWSQQALEQISFLESNGLSQLRGFVINHLEYEPLDEKKKRLYFFNDKTQIAYRTWRILFEVNTISRQVSIQNISSGYTSNDLQTEEDRYNDKKLHLKFLDWNKETK